MTIDQILYIREYHKKYTHRALADQLKLKETQVSSFCRRYNLKSNKLQDPFNLKCSREPIPIKVKTGKYWPPDHTNKSREDYVNFYLSSWDEDLNGPTGHGDLCVSDADPGL